MCVDALLISCSFVSVPVLFFFKKSKETQLVSMLSSRVSGAPPSDAEGGDLDGVPASLRW